MKGALGPVGTSTDTAVALVREEGRWEAGLLPGALLRDLDGLISALRQQPGDAGAIGLVNVGDDFFVALRVRGDEVRLLLSDVTAALEWDLAEQVLDRLGDEPPGEDDLDQVVPAGDLSIFADFGLDEMELAAVLADIDAYADEMIAVIAARLGFAEPYARALEAPIR